MNICQQVILKGLVLSVLVSTPVLASDKQKGGGDRPQRPEFSSLDLNSDSEISFEEFSSHELPHGDHETIFNNIDTDGSGFISETEFTSHKPPRPKR